jgi:hypothetical protein
VKYNEKEDMDINDNLAIDKAREKVTKAKESDWKAENA